MIGAIIGDVIGSRFEFNNHKSKDFALFTRSNDFTDDSICTIATMEWLNDGLKKNYDEYLLKWCRKYPNPMGGYGGSFARWIVSKNPEPYNSFGNGSAMRVSPVGMYAETLEDCLELAEKTAVVTHSHPEGIKGAKATAHVIFLARTGSDKKTIRETIEREYGYDLSRTVDEIRETYFFNETCQQTVPESIICFLESDSFEDAIRNAISIGGDSDTIGCIVGGLSEAFYGSTDGLEKEVDKYLPLQFKRIIKMYYERL